MEQENPVLKVFSMVFALLVAAAVLCFCSGCEEDIRDILSVGPDTKHDSDPVAEVGGDGETPSLHGASATGSLVYKYGGFNGGNAAEDPNTQIKDLHISRSKLTYKWASGNLSNWGLSYDDAHALACAFYWDGKQWIGGKFDWISTSRTSRNWNNLNGHYNGWNADAFWAASKRAFCIVSEDGRKRTNLLETKEP